MQKFYKIYFKDENEKVLFRMMQSKIDEVIRGIKKLDNKIKEIN